jgi:UDP-N-acetylglucosamine transferase subunit ALG13
MLMQIGRGLEPPITSFSNDGFEMDYYRYKDSINEDIKSADLVISHAGIKLLELLESCSINMKAVSCKIHMLLVSFS